ncbi:hypothetical protein [Haloglomus halophilum]|uniref:hypothetical protein n=1 Tax=Haloglomus halophilum TaxID=2962672 RepID=UPI0020C96D64|nr:hypothetical protein [Haloglomus halophilum]
MGILKSVNADSLQEHVHEEMAISHLFSTYTDDHETAIIDDGLYQFFLFLLVGEQTYSPTTLIESLPRPDVLVIVDAPTDVCFERQETRTRGRIGPFRGLDDQEVMRFIDAMRTAVDRLAEVSSQQGIRTICLSNTEGLETAAETLVDALSTDRPG